MSFTYTPGIPNPPDPPSGDVSNMQTNTNSIGNWVAVDHLGFNSGIAGQHKVVTFPNVQTGAVAPFANTYPISQVFPKSFGTAATTEELYYADSSSSARASINRLIPTVKVYAMVNWNGAVWTLLGSASNNLQVNAASISATSTAGFTLNFTTALDYTTYSCFVGFAGNAQRSGTISSQAFSSFIFTLNAIVGPAQNTTVTLMVI